MLIGGLQKMTLVDYPGKIAVTVFTVGCNFRCGFCHNPELIANLGTSFPIGNEVPKLELTPEEDFFAFLESRKDKLDGVCITGGEPTLQKDLPDFLRKIKGLEVECQSGRFAVKLDTNGTHPDVLEVLIEERLVDYVAMDIKAPAELKHEIRKSVPVGHLPKGEKYETNSKSKISKYENITNTKVDLEKIRKSVKIIKKSGEDGKIDYEFRTTVLPKFHTKEDLIKIGEFLQGVGVSSRQAGQEGKCKKYFLQQFRNKQTLDTSLENEPSFSSEEMQKFCEMLEPYFGHCGVRD